MTGRERTAASDAPGVDSAGHEEGRPGAGDELLRVVDVYKNFGEERVLEGISFAMQSGEVTVMVGPSGSGKSTMLRCINRLTDIDEGAIYLDGEEVSAPAYDVDDLRREVGMVFQDINLFTHLTARGNVTLGLKRVLGLDDAEARARADEHLERVGVLEQAESYPAEMSGGQKQRVGIARALALEPKLMLFDEPTSSLDPELTGDVLRVMRSLAEEGMTMIVVTHEMAFARSAANKLLFLDEGTILERGSPEQLFEAPEHDRTREFLRRIDISEGDGP